MMLNPYDSMIDSLKNETGSVVTDLAEVGIDFFLEGDMTKQIPLLSTIVSTYKIGKSVIELNHLRQLAIFINELNCNIVDDNQRTVYINKLRNKGEKEFCKELEYVVLITSRYLDRDKSRYLAKLYLAYWDCKINWEQFTSYSEVLDRLLPGDLSELKKGHQFDIDNCIVSDALLRLMALGLIITDAKEMNTPTTVGTIKIPANNVKDYRLTSFGEVLRKCLFN